MTKLADITGKEPLGETLAVGFDTWEKCLPLLLIGYSEGTATGRQLAMEGLQKMAKVADMAVNMSSVPAGEQQEEA